MEGKIDAGGSLVINRNGHVGGLCVQCPFTMNAVSCGDWCAHFGEPERYSGYFTEIRLCHDKVWVFDKFTDERKPFHARQQEDV